MYKEKWQDAMTYEAYCNYISERLEQGQSTNDNNTQAFLEYTKMNQQRMNRLEKTFKEDESLSELFAHIKSFKVLVITEGWCGDAAQNIPILEKYANIVGVETRYVLRDQHNDLMEKHLTNGGQSIPIFIFLDEKWQVAFTWGPRPQPVQQMVMDYKAKPEPKEPYAEFAKNVQLWYAKDKQKTIEAELKALISNVNSVV